MKELPEGKVLNIEVTDVDLAGDVHRTMSRIRVMTDVYAPRIEFSYQLVDQNKNVLLSGSENLKDRNYLMGSNLRYRNEFLGYEKNMLDEWFKDTFVDMLVEKK